MDEPNFKGTEWDVIRAGAMEVDEQTGHNSKSDQTQELCDKIDSVASTLKGMLQSGDPQLSSGVAKFMDKLSAPRLRPKLASAFHQFGWEMGTTTVKQGGQLLLYKLQQQGERERSNPVEAKGRYPDDLVKALI